MSAVGFKDCEVCLSAGSVNKWGICEICGEESIDTVAMFDLRKVSITQVRTTEETPLKQADAKPASISTAGQDAA